MKRRLVSRLSGTMLRAVPTKYRGWARLAARSAADRSGPLSLSRRLNVVRTGFLPDYAVLYDFPRNDSRDYLSELAREVHGPLANGEAGRAMLNDKADFARHMERMPHLVPRYFGRIIAGKFQPADRNSGMRDLLARFTRLIVKPTNGRRGTGILIVTSADDRRLVDIQDAIVSEFAEQAGYAAQIFPGTANTVRVHMLRDEDGPFIAAAAHRFGTAQSYPVDHWSLGGVCASVDVDTGELGPGCLAPPKRPIEWTETHPETGSRITGIRIPMWEQMLHAIAEVGKEWPFLRHVGWDVVMTDTGPRILEGNNHPGVRVLQVHGGLLRDKRTRLAYQQLGFL